MVRVWDAAHARVLATLQGHTASIVSLTFSPDKSRLASGAADETVRVWEAGTWRAEATLQGHTASTWRGETTLQGHATSVIDVAFSPDGARLVSRSEDAVDRRIKRIALTDAGRDKIARLNAARRGGLLQFVSTLSDEERERFHRALAPVLGRPDVHAFLQEISR